MNKQTARRKSVPKDLEARTADVKAGTLVSSVLKKKQDTDNSIIQKI